MDLLQILNKIFSKNSGLCHKWSLKIFQNLFWYLKIAFEKYFNKIDLKNLIKRLILALIILKNCSTIYPVAVNVQEMIHNYPKPAQNCDYIGRKKLSQLSWSLKKLLGWVGPYENQCWWL